MICTIGVLQFQHVFPSHLDLIHISLVGFFFTNSWFVFFFCYSGVCVPVRCACVLVFLSSTFNVVIGICSMFWHHLYSICYILPIPRLSLFISKPFLIFAANVPLFVQWIRFVIQFTWMLLLVSLLFALCTLRWKRIHMNAALLFLLLLLLLLIYFFSVFFFLMVPFIYSIPFNTWHS